MEKIYRISFCTVCMNRLHHLRQTLPVNIADNLNYPDIEFVLLDYNSSDGLEEYVKNELSEYVESGRLVYYKTKEPAYFRRSHSRNVVFKLATGELICNVDADNFMGKDFAFYINELFQGDKNVCLKAAGAQGEKTPKDIVGRICVRKDEFLALTGYDESMDNYGYEDYDLIYRLEMNGATKLVIDNDRYLNAIKHTDKERIANEYLVNNLEMILVHYVDPSITDVLYLYADQTYQMGTILDNYTMGSVKPIILRNESMPAFQYSIQQDGWVTGHWEKRDNSIHFISNNESEQVLQYNTTGNWFYDKAISRNYYSIVNKGRIQTLLLFNSDLTNRAKLQKNKAEGNLLVNKSAFGECTVFKNFNDQLPISV